ncbi:MAG: hypothetical protein R3D00_28025 [Bacteroidia bacterium]
MKILKLVLIIGLTFVGFLLVAKWILRGAFGPIYRTVEIEVNNDKTIICKETYSADFAGVFYDVDFTLKEKNKEDINLGQVTFSNENWDEGLTLNEIKIGDWIVLPIEQGSRSIILMTNQKLKIFKDTTFSPLYLHHDKKWKNRYGELSPWPYGVGSKIDSIVRNDLYINYKYRIGINSPSKFYYQTIRYKMELTTGNFTTDTIFDRID